MDPSTSTGGSTCRLRSPPFRRIRFLRGSSQDDVSSHSKQLITEDSLTKNSTEAGLDARDFYESVISATPNSTPPQRSTTPGKTGRKVIKNVVKMKGKDTTKPVSSQRQSERVQMRTVHQYLRSAQEGDVKTVEELLCEGSVDINVVDDFSWTALMCASYSGQRDIVALLLRKGALWECQHDKSGQTALDLARRVGHLDIVRMLEGNQSIGSCEGHRKKTQSKFAKSWCNICRVEYHESSKHKHRSSTVHLFNCQHKPQSTMYYIPESNVGFQLMMKDGWDKEKGLGPDGSGQKFPVKTILKRDRKGLGAADKDDEAARARVTHFKPFDVQAVKRPHQLDERKLRTNTLDKRAKKQSKMREKDWERDFRQSFHPSF